MIELLLRQRRTLLVTLVGCLCVALAYLLYTTTTFTSTASVLVQVGLAGQIGNDGKLTSNSAILGREADVVASTPVLLMALDQQGVADLPSLARIDDSRRVGFIRSQIKIETGTPDEPLKVSYTSTRAEDSAVIVNAVVDAYVNFQTGKMRDQVKAVVNSLELTKKQREQELADKQARLEALVKQSPTVNQPQDMSGSPALQQLTRLREQREQARLDALKAKADYEEIVALLLSDPVKAQQVEQMLKNGAVMAGSPDEINALRGELKEAQKSLAEAMRKYLPAHPVVKDAKKLVDQTSVAYAAAVRAEQIVTEVREKEYQASLDQQEKLSAELTAKASEYKNLSKQLAGIEQESTALDARIKEAVHQHEAGAINLTVQDRGDIPLEPSHPKPQRTMLIGLIAGLVLGLSLALARDRAMAGLRNATEIKRTLDLPVLGAVPSIDTVSNPTDRATIAIEPEGPISEAYRSIRTAIYTGLAKDRCKTLLVTSSEPGEGKSTLVSNLGISLADSGLRTLVIDCDFRAPAQHLIFKVPHQVGFAGVLAGEELLDDAIASTSIDHLDVLPAGPVFGNAAELINQPLFSDLIEQLSARYDRIVIDSPPVLMVADARIVSAAVDLTLLVIRPSKSLRKMVELAKEGLLSVGANLIGIVVNDVRKHEQSSFGGLGYFPYANNIELGTDNMENTLSGGQVPPTYVKKKLVGSNPRSNA